MRDGFIKVAAASPSLKVGNPSFNKERIIDLMTEADRKGVKVLVFPELSITGYTAGDLFFQSALLESATEALLEIAEASAALDVLSFVGYPLRYNGKLYNTAAAVKGGRILAFVAKRNLPNYSEFYEERWFTPSPKENLVLESEDGDILFGSRIIFSASFPSSLKIAAEICEDLWVPDPPSTHHAAAGATVLVNLSASDEIIGKSEYRRALVSGQAARTVSAYIYADASEGESTTDMVFTGSNVISENGTILASVEYSCDSLLITEVDTDRLERERAARNTYMTEEDGYDYIDIEFDEEETLLTRPIDPHPFVPSDEDRRRERCEKILTLQALGLKRRLSHTKSRKVVVGLSGGLDSTLALLVAVRAFDMLSLDRKGIVAITMPCFGTTGRTKSNAEKLALAEGVDFRTIDIGESVKSHFRDIGQSMDDLSVTFENGQARERTQVLMDVANKEGALVIGTGDLSELALGWATYNGDHMSMYGVNGGVPKTLVRHLVRYVAETTSIKEEAEVLLDILATPVSPELLPARNGEISQVTEDLVGPYELHDFFLYNMVRLSFSPGKIFRLASIAFSGIYDCETIYKWERTFIRRFFQQQFKRSCLPDGPKVGTITLSPRSDWRMPSDGDSEIWLKALDEEWEIHKSNK
ncbi:MAG: NAD(+) synthase [Candidatus Ornithospirochaeta sp.]|nr:NAD(+) synthase [Sphaerochaetaceae bacterium]MDY5523285.1 NAD(+) synthase [Candidatus Ornithospirochaeta sp.]